MCLGLPNYGCPTPGGLADPAIGPLQPQTLEPNKAPLQPLSLCSDVSSFFHIQSQFFLSIFFFQRLPSRDKTDGSSTGHSNVTTAQPRACLILPCFPCICALPIACQDCRTSTTQQP
ncbi:hypothetical protein CABS03_09461 [Colletotrichum abscissum]|uniref:Uncharacterized protein n=1 Tax=Colletotrichum abscissum TaxID=1671311 RepID=A0A9P9X2J1_9PEZI|nr:hypothetical protein CABS02_13823 [Colletotrichum abscissum]